MAGTVTFENLSIVSVFVGESKKNKQPLAHVEFFLPDSNDFFDCWFYGDEALAFAEFEPHTVVNTLTFTVRSNNNHKPELHPYLY